LNSEVGKQLGEDKLIIAAGAVGGGQETSVLVHNLVELQVWHIGTSPSFPGLPIAFAVSILGAIGKLPRFRFPLDTEMRLFVTASTLVIFVLAGTPVCCRGQEMETPKPARIGFPWDWTHQHVIFTNTANPEVLEKIRHDPRLFHHWLMRNLPLFEQNLIGTVDPDSSTVPALDDHKHRGRPKRRKRPTLQTDWNTGLGNSGFVKGNTFPAKWTLDVNATPSCTQDYVAFPTGANGSASQASIVAFNQLYSTQGSTGGQCAQNGPSVAWAYINAPCPALSSSDPIKGSPVLSLDGSKIAWVTATGKVQVLTVGTTGLNGAAATQGAILPPVPECIGGLINNAVLSSVTLSGSPAASNSAVFVDYLGDVGYVGDDSGKLHKLTPFFNGSLAEVTTGGWPVTVSSATTKILTGPVFDSISNNIFIGDDEGTAGKLFYVRIAAGSLGACNAGSNGGNPPCLGNATLTVSSQKGLSDSPVVDSSNGWVYIQTSNANGTNAQIIQADTTLTTVSPANVGGTSGNDLHSGAFDNTYFNSGPTNSNARYYVCGLDSGGSNSVVYQFGFNGITGRLNSSSTTSLAVTSANNTPCSPLTEGFNPNATGGAKDWLFLSVPDHGAGVSCGNKPCVFQIDITNAPATLSIGQTGVYSPNQGTSGIIIDNVSTLSETSNLYFVTLAARVCTTGGNGACATKLHQSNLQ
jgi:hypothetical protein